MERTLLTLRTFACQAAFDRSARNAALAADPGLRVDLMRSAAAAFTQFEVANASGAVAEIQALPQSLLNLERHIAGTDLPEHLVSDLIGWGPIDDLLTELGKRAKVHEKFSGSLGPGAITLAWLREVCDSDPVTASRLALWARRIVGDSLRAATDVARLPEFAPLVGEDLGDLTAVLTAAHARRMGGLHLTA